MPEPAKTLGNSQSSIATVAHGASHAAPQGPTTAETGSPPAPVRIRPAVWALGVALWATAVTAMVGLWYAQRLRAADKQRQVVTQGTKTPAAANSPQRIISLDAVAKPNEDGSFVVDIGDLMNEAREQDGNPTAGSSVWDPAGIEDFSFTNAADGRPLTKADLLGKPWAVCFVFTKCLGPCPTVTRQLKTLQDLMKGSGYRLVTLTVDPARDTPEVLKEYARLNGADPQKWHFLTGDQSAIYGLIHRSFKMPVEEVQGPGRQPGYEVIHSTNVMLVDRNGVVQGKFNAAIDTEMAALRRQLQALADEAVPR